MSDIKYILKRFGVSFVVIPLAFFVDLAQYYRVDFTVAARRLFTGDIYSLTYYGILILFGMVVWELWGIIYETLDTKQQYIALIVFGILAVISLFLPIFSLFSYIIFLYCIAIILYILYQLFIVKK